MRRFSFLIGFMLINLLCFAQGIQFETELTWKQIQEKAKKENKYILVDCYATWCGPCKQMDKEVYPDGALGKLVNKDFIAVKVQLDETKNDDARMKSWSADAKSLQQQYNVYEMPTLLFFDPNGELCYRKIGYVSVADFKDTLTKSKENPYQKYQNQLALFKEGRLPYADMPTFSQVAYDESKDKQTSKAAADKYIREYLVKLPTEQLLTHANISFLIGRAEGNITSESRFFKLCFEEPDKWNVYRMGLADEIINWTISSEELFFKLYKNGKPVIREPDWNRLSATIKKKYGRERLDATLPKMQISFYRGLNNWEKYVELKNKHLKTAKLTSGGGKNGDASAQNSDAWDMFEKCDDKKLLISALAWSDLSIKISSENDPILYAYYDTKASLLYKLGHTDIAIETEKAAIKIDEKITGERSEYYEGILDKMLKRGSIVD